MVPDRTKTKSYKRETENPYRLPVSFYDRSGTKRELRVGARQNVIFFFAGAGHNYVGAGKTLVGLGQNLVGMVQNLAGVGHTLFGAGHILSGVG